MNFANHIDMAARNVPTRTAVSDGTSTLTYEQLKEETNAAANMFSGLGLDPGQRIGICLSNQLELLITYFGAMKQGSVPVFINPHFNDELIEYIIDMSNISTVVTDSQFANIGKRVETPITVDGSFGNDFHKMIESESEAFDIYPQRNENIAEILYTSGTTSRPKGVRHSHGNLQANAIGVAKYVKLDRREVGLAAAPCYHVMGLNVTTTPLLFGEAEVHLLPEITPQKTFEAIESHKVTFSAFMPTMLLELLEYSDVSKYDLSSLEVLIAGGEPMPERRINEVEQLFGCTLIEGYGMTETSPLAAVNPPNDNKKDGSVGPVASEVVELRIEDIKTAEQVDQGKRGELLWHGDTVTPGYESEFDDILFVERDGKRWLRSADIGWVDEEGYLYIVDRREDIFNTSTTTIYPREIENVLNDIDGVVQSAVIGIPKDLRGSAIIAIIDRTDGDLTNEEILDICKSNLKKSQVPERVEFVNSIPRTSTGKVDRATLRNIYAPE
jgi:long-chain acyl-CoA synthetase